MSDVTVVIASPRRDGNCSAIAGRMAEALEAAGRSVDLYRLNEVDAKGCQACQGCKRAGRCVRRDGLTPVLESIAASPALIFALPNYMGMACSQYRMMEDRFYGFLGQKDGKPCLNIPAGKRLAVVVSSGSGRSQEIFDEIRLVMGRALACEIVGEINYGSSESGPAAQNEAVLAEAAELALKL